MSIAFIDLKAQQARIRDKIENGLGKVLDHGAYIMGPEITNLENRLGYWTGATHKHNLFIRNRCPAISTDGVGIESGAGCDSAFLHLCSECRGNALHGRHSSFCRG